MKVGFCEIHGVVTTNDSGDCHPCLEEELLPSVYDRPFEACRDCRRESCYGCAEHWVHLTAEQQYDALQHEDDTGYAEMGESSQL